MSDLEKYEPPEPGLGDALYTALQGYLSVVSVAPRIEIAVIATAANALLTGLFPSPLAKRDREWMKKIGEVVQHLEENQIDPKKLLSDELFITILIQASQKAIQNHQIEKINALRNAVFNSALGINIRDDLQLVFIRYLGELTPSHLILLKFFLDKEQQLAQVNSYEQLFEEFSTENAQNIGRDEFKLLCEDLTSRYLLRISSEVDDFGGVYELVLLATESFREGPMLMVTDIGKKLLKFIAEPDL